MRTDSTRLSSQAMIATRNGIIEMYGDDYLFERVRNYTAKGKTAQKAHKPYDHLVQVYSSRKIGIKGSREFKLYDLIWKRTIATQMAEAELGIPRTPLQRLIRELLLIFDRAERRFLFPGFFRAYVEGSDDTEICIGKSREVLPYLLTVIPQIYKN